MVPYPYIIMVDGPSNGPQNDVGNFLGPCSSILVRTHKYGYLSGVPVGTCSFVISYSKARD